MVNLDSFFVKKAVLEKTVKATPVNGAARFFYLIFTHFAKLVGLNMLFLLFCLPVITIPAALSGMSRVTMLLSREGTADVWRDFIGEFKSSFFKSLPLGALCSFFLADAVLCVWLSTHVTTAGTAIAMLAAALLLTIFTILLGCYAFAQLSLVTLRNADILRNTLLLILTQPKTDLFLLLTAGGGIAAIVLFLPYSVPVISVIGPAILSLAVCTAVRKPLERLILSSSD